MQRNQAIPAGNAGSGGNWRKDHNLDSLDPFLEFTKEANGQFITLMKMQIIDN